MNEGGHLASASTLGEWQDINATCASSGQTDCWFGAHQLADQALPSAGWYWQVGGRLCCDSLVLENLVHSFEC